MLSPARSWGGYVRGWVGWWVGGWVGGWVLARLWPPLNWVARVTHPSLVIGLSTRFIFSSLSIHLHITIEWHWSSFDLLHVSLLLTLVRQGEDYGKFLIHCTGLSHQWMLPLFWVAQVTYPSACWWSNGWGWWRVFDPLLLWSQLVIVAISQLGAVVTTLFSVISYCTVQLLMVKQVRAVSDLSTLLVAPVCSYTDWSLCSANVVTSENHSTVSNVNTCK